MDRREPQDTWASFEANREHPHKGTHLMSRDTAPAQKFTFDVKLFATISVEANNEASARALLRQHLEWVHVSFEPTDSAVAPQPVCAEASPDGEPDLLEIDGEPV